MEWLLIVVGLGIAAAALRTSVKPDEFRTAATSLELDHSRTVPDMLPRLSGTIKGLPVRIDVPERGVGQVRYRIFYPALGMALRLERETNISRTLGSLGSGDREIGDKAFDAAFRINTSRPDALQKVMTPELRRQLVALVDRYPGVVVADGEITLVTDDQNPTAETLVGTVSDLVTVGALLNANRPPPLERPSVPARPVREPTPTGPVTAPPPTAPPQGPPRSEPPARSEATPPPDPPPPDPPTPAAPSTGLPDGFFDDVFGENRLSFEADETFAREIQGTEVRLTGTVKQSSAYEDREDNIPPTGTKAVVTVAQIDTDLYGKTDIDAVVFLHGNAEFDRGESIAFTGRIDGIDAFMRNLFVVDAKLSSPR